MQMMGCHEETITYVLVCVTARGHGLCETQYGVPYLSFEFRVFIQRTDHTLAGLPTTDRPPSNLVASPRYN